MIDKALIERLRALSAWLQERNLDMEMPAGMIDPAEAADRLEALTGGGEEPVVWLTPGGDVTRSHTYAVEQSANDVLNYPKAIYLSPPSGRVVGREEIAACIERYVWQNDGGRLVSVDLAVNDILALFSSPSLGGEGKQEDRPSQDSQNDQCADAGPSPRSHGGERVLILASYCGGDNPSCSEARPCNDCLAMCNVAITTGDLHIIGELSSAPDPQAQQDDAASVLSDPHAVHLNMLRGGLAKLTPAQIGHLYRGEEAEAVIAELRRQNPQQDVGER